MTDESDRHEQLIRIWEKAVDTQMHFNEMSVKSRQLGLTFVAAALGVAVVLLSEQKDFALPLDVGGHLFVLHVSVLLILGAWLAIRAVRVLDLNVYHRMLRGAVAFGEDFERHYLSEIFDLNKGMTEAITHYSRHDDASVVNDQKSRKYWYKGSGKKSAEAKIMQFYDRISTSLIIGAFAVLIITNFETLFS